MIDSKIFKAYDIRGVYPDQIDEDLAYKIGQAYCRVVSPDRPVVVGMDVRIHSGILKDALIRGIIDTGVDVIDIDLGLYRDALFCCWKLRLCGRYSGHSVA